MFNLSLILEDSARRYADKPAISCQGQQMTYAELDQQANQVANALKGLQIEPGDKVAMSLPNILQFPVVYYGILKTGAVVVPLNILLKRDEITHHLTDSEAKIYFCYSNPETLAIEEEALHAFHRAPKCTSLIFLGKTTVQPDEHILLFPNFIEEGLPVYETALTTPDDTAVLVYTSGTTGQPKGAALTHSSLFCNANLVTEIFRTSNEDVLLVVLPLFHIFGMTTLMNAGFLKGTHQILIPKFDPKTVIEAIVQYKVSLFAEVPTMYWALLHYKHEDIPDQVIQQNMRLFVSGGASLPIKVLEEIQQRFHVAVLEGYGMSEGSPVVTFNDERIGCKPGSIGTPVWGVEVKIVDPTGLELGANEPGELIYKGHNVMKAYYNNPIATAEVLKNGWLHSGDIAYKDYDGFYFIVDRSKDMIIRGGMNVYSLEVEEAMMKHPAISLVAVIGVPDDRLGEEITAFVVLKDQQTLSADELIEWAKERLAKYKYPRSILFVDALPLSATGKILKKQLRLNTK